MAENLSVPVDIFVGVLHTQRESVIIRGENRVMTDIVWVSMAVRQPRHGDNEVEVSRRLHSVKNP